jgi:hypothetical protein
VAEKYPKLLVRETIEFEEVLSDEAIRYGTRVVTAPGKFETKKRTSGCRAIVSKVVFYALVAVLLSLLLAFYLTP